MSAVASYVQQRDGEFFVGESRVTLASVVANWQRGEGPERIQQAFPQSAAGRHLWRHHLLSGAPG